MVGAQRWGVTAPVVEELEWMTRALCIDHDPEFWFPPSGGGRNPAARMKAKTGPAKAVCADCPVREECLVYAFETGQRHGVWGGLDEYERADLKRRRVVRS